MYRQFLIFFLFIQVCQSHLLQTLKNLHISSNDQLRWRISVDHSTKGYLEVAYFNDPTTCRDLNSIYYYQLATCLRSGDPDAKAEFVMLTMILKEKEYRMQWTYYRDSKCTSIVGYPVSAKVTKDLCTAGSTIVQVAKIPTSPRPGYTSNSILVMLFDHWDLCTSRSPATAIQAVFTPLNQCLYSYYGDSSYTSCGNLVFGGTEYGSRDGSCSGGSTTFQHLANDPCQSKDINLDATYNGYSHFICYG